MQLDPLDCTWLLVRSSCGTTCLPWSPTLAKRLDPLSAVMRPRMQKKWCAWGANPLFTKYGMGSILHQTAARVVNTYLSKSHEVL